MPGPWGLPFIGVGFELLKPEQFLQRLEIISNKYKTPFISWLGPKCFLYVNDPVTVETIFNSPHCLNKGDFYEFLGHAIGDGLFTSKVPRWNKHRRLLNPSFKRSAINNILPIFNHQADLFIENLFKKQQEQQPFDLYDSLKRNILQTSFATTMGQSESSHQNNEDSSFIFNSYNGITEVCVIRMLRPWLYPNFIYHLSNLYKKEKKCSLNLQRLVENLLKKSSPSTSMSMSIDNISNLNENGSNKCDDKSAKKDINRIVNELRHDKNAGTTTESKPLGFMQQMHNYIERQLLTWQDVRDEANVIVAATFETTSTALYFVCLCLAMHPECQQKLYHEFVDIFTKCNDDENDDKQQEQDAFYKTDGHKLQTNINNMAEQTTQSMNECTNSRESISDINADVYNGGPDNCHVDGHGDSDDIPHDHKYQLITKHITIEQLKRMKYTEMVINEAMRLFAPVPVVLRQASDSFQLNDGCTIPKGTQIAIDIFNMQRSENVWGMWAKKFQPELHFSQTSTQAATAAAGAAEAVASTAPQTSFAFIPFTKGLRMCIGYRYAMTLMKIMLAKIFSNFQLQTDARLHELKVKGTISLKLQEYPMLKIQRLQQQ